MILSAQTIKARVLGEHPWGPLMISPFSERTKEFGLSYGLSSCGYDIRIGGIDRINADLLTDKEKAHWTATKTVPVKRWFIEPGEFILLSALEFMSIPNDLCARVLDKSTWARLGICVQNTIIEPGWKGHLTLEVTNHSKVPTLLKIGMPICQIIFEQLDYPTDQPYTGKYQDQEAKPVHAILEQG